MALTLPRRGGNPNWKPGVSGNPKGAKPGVRQPGTRALLAEAQKLGIDPLMYMLMVIKELEQQAVALMKDGNQAEANELRLGAADIAARACPYLHPKLAAITAD